MLLTYARDHRHPAPRTHTNIAHDEQGVRYFKERGRWTEHGEKARKLSALLASFRRSDWGNAGGYFHISGCPCNQYLAATCTAECETMQDMVYELGGFPDDFEPYRDERNEYRSSVETYG